MTTCRPGGPAGRLSCTSGRAGDWGGRTRTALRATPDSREITATPATRLMIAVNTLLARGRGEQQDVQQPGGEQRTCGGDDGIHDSGGAAQAARGRRGQYGYAQDAAGNEHAGHYHEGGHHGGGHAACPESARIQRRRLFRLVDIQAIWGYHPGTSAQDVRGEDPY